ncbi:MAG: molybdopterin-dependent oxidoreductase [Chloroflexi bacterium]|nr:molybdopterin-dependent oxidoreductase [Chloroflexota bacterium]
MSARDGKVGRRTFLKGAGVAAAAAAGAGATACSSVGSKEHQLPVSAAGTQQWGREAGTWTPSACMMCGGQSGILVHVANGVVDKIEPNPWNPVNYSNISTDWFDGYTVENGCKEGGSLCPKGNAGIQALYDPDRVKTPLKRTNPDRTPGADPKWQQITWDQALDEIAAKMKTLRDAGEPHKLFWLSEDASFVDIQTDFTKLYGTPNFGLHSNLCDVARKASFKTVMGHDRPLTDFMNSKYILLFGWNPTSAIKWVYLPRIITRAIENGARMVVVDPYLSDTAVKGQEWVSIRPGTDGALALALGHVIIRDKLYDEPFVKNWVSGFEEYAAYVADKTPQWAEEITSVPAKTIERIARELATTKPAIVDVWSGPGQHSNGVQGGRAIAALSVLIGGIDRKGALVIPEKAGLKHVDPPLDDATATALKQPRIDELSKYPMGHGSGVYTQLFSNIAEGKGPYQPKMGVIVMQNVMMSVPSPQTTAKALAKLETLVVVDTMLSETAMMADYVLPGTNYLERYEAITYWVTWQVIGLRQPVVKPLFGQPAEYEIFTALGRRLGLKTKEGKEFFKVGLLSGQPIDDLTQWYEDYMSAELKGSPAGLTLPELKALPGAVWVDKRGTRYEKFLFPLAEDRLKTAWYEGDQAADGTLVYDKPKDQGGVKIGIVMGGKPLAGFATPSGKLELVTKSLATKKDANGNAVDPLPVYTPRDWQPSKEFPLYLINWKEASHTHTRTQNNPFLLEIKPSSPLIMHPTTAGRLDLADGDPVWIESQFGKVKGELKVSKRMHPEVVGLQHGFGHTALGRNAAGRGTTDGPLRPSKSDPLSGQASHKEATVRVYKA